MVDVVLDGERLVQTGVAPVRSLSYEAVAGVMVGGPTTAVNVGGKVGGIHAFV